MGLCTRSRNENRRQKRKRIMGEGGRKGGGGVYEKKKRKRKEEGMITRSETEDMKVCYCIRQIFGIFGVRFYKIVGQERTDGGGRLSEVMRKVNNRTKNSR